MNWEKICDKYPQQVHYSVFRKHPAADGMECLRQMFPEGTADEMNFVLFSTSGVHGTYNTIEEAEMVLDGACDEDEAISEVTFLVVHPRIVTLRYGNCEPKNKDDIEFLKKLRDSSVAAVSGIGFKGDA